MRQMLALVLTSALVMGSPGPSMISLTAVGAAFGVRRSLGYLAGLVVGTTVVLLAVAVGVLSLLLPLPRVAPVLLGASAAYLLYLAFRVATAPPLAGRQHAAAPSWIGGLLLAIANPKAYLAIAAVFAGSPLEPVAKAVVLTAMILVIHLVWLLVGASFARLLHDPASARIVNLLSAAALVGSVVLAISG